MDLTWVWDSLAGYALGHLPYISPFWGWLVTGILVSLAVSAVSWYFPVLRSLAGAVVLSVVAALVGYRRGDTDRAAHDQIEITRLKRRDQPPQNNDQTWWKW